MRSSWVVKHDEKSFCSRCGQELELLCKEFSLSRRDPMFYICWACKKVFQAGVGEVREEK